MMEPGIIVTFTLSGLKSAVIQADNEGDQIKAEEARDRIAPCLEIADTILKKTSAGPRG